MSFYKTRESALAELRGMRTSHLVLLTASTEFQNSYIAQMAKAMPHASQGDLIELMRAIVEGAHEELDRRVPIPKEST